MIVSMTVSHFVKICQVLTIVHQLICRGVANFGTWCRLCNLMQQKDDSTQVKYDVEQHVGK